MSSAPSASARRVAASTSATGSAPVGKFTTVATRTPEPGELRCAGRHELGPHAHRRGAVLTCSPAQLVDAVGRMVVGEVGQVDQADRSAGAVNAVHTSNVADAGSNSVRGMLPVSRRSWRSAGVSASTSAT